eukprot:scaffold6130_cov50-Phaeocystis_antarctica.AAC.2
MIVTLTLTPTRPPRHDRHHGLPRRVQGFGVRVGVRVRVRVPRRVQGAHIRLQDGYLGLQPEVLRVAAWHHGLPRRVQGVVRGLELGLGLGLGLRLGLGLLAESKARTYGYRTDT